MIERIKKYTIFIILTIIIPVFIVLCMNVIYFLVVGYSDTLTYTKYGDVPFGKKILYPNGAYIYIILHIKACIIFSILALLSFILSFYYRLYGLIYVFIFSISYVLANTLDYYGIINNSTMEFYFSLFISFIISSLLYSYIYHKRKNKVNILYSKNFKKL